MASGVDVSGDPESGNHKYMAVFACTEEFVNAAVRHLQLDVVGGGSGNKREARKSILAALDFDAHECLALCIRIERKKLLSIGERAAKTRGSNLRTRKILYAYHRAVWHSARDRIENFLNQNKQDFDDAVFESDGDCIEFLKDAAVRRTSPSYAHMIADALAWANNACNAPKGIIEIDATAQIARSLLR